MANNTFKILNSNDRSLSMITKGIDLSIINSIRRIILADIPTAAFSYDSLDPNSGVQMIVNTGILHNEMLAHRISMIPLYFPAEVIENESIDDYKFVLKKINNTVNIVSVTTADFKIYKNDVLLSPKMHKTILPPNDITNDYILITKLKSKGEEIHIECTPSINIAKKHARWCPVSKCVSFNVIDEDAAELAFKTSGKSRKEFNTLDIYRYFKKNKFDEPSELEFNIESECGLTPVYIVHKAFNILIQKLNGFIENIYSKNKNITIEKMNINDMFQVTIRDETFTLVNVINNMIFNNNLRTVNTDTPLSYIGYYQPHPLDNMICMKMIFKNSANYSTEDVKQFLKSNVEDIVLTVEKFKAKFAKRT